MQHQVLRRMKALIIKEYFQIIRDPSSFLISIVLPLILLFVYGFGVSLDLNHLKVGLVLEDTAPDVQSFAKSMTDSPFFDVKFAKDRRELDRDIISGNIRGFVVVPSYFSAFRQRQDNIAPIQVIADGSEPNTANFVQNYVRGAFQNWLQQEHISSNLQGLPLVELQARYWYNEELESRNFLIPGSLAIIMSLIGTLLTALVVAREWERGTMESMMTTPVSIVELLVGKVVPYFLLGFVTLAMCMVVSVFFYGVPFRGSILALCIVSGVFLVTALGLGLLISTISKNQFVAGQISTFTAFLPAFMLSGFIFEISSMPWIIQAVTYFITARYYVSALQTLFLVGDVWELLTIDIILMTAIGLIFFSFITRVTRKRLE